MLVMLLSEIIMDGFFKDNPFGIALAQPSIFSWQADANDPLLEAPPRKPDIHKFLTGFHEFIWWDIGPAYYCGA
jgi:hypothetical protein